MVSLGDERRGGEVRAKRSVCVGEGQMADRVDIQDVEESGADR